MYGCGKGVAINEGCPGKGVSLFIDSLGRGYIFVENRHVKYCMH